MIGTAIYQDVGPRENLEDSALAAVMLAPDGQEVSTLVLCDGAGGERAGEVASILGTTYVQVAMSGFFTTSFLQVIDGPVCLERIGKALTQALYDANQAILAAAGGQPDKTGMASTVVCAVVAKDMLITAWAGDSRCYLFHEGTLTRLSRDHSEIAELLALGMITPDESAFHPSAHTITRYLGQLESFRPEVRFTPISPGDLVLLCTDGLTDVLTDKQIEHILQSNPEGHVCLKELANELVRSALARRTQDNTTVVLYEHRANTDSPGPTDPRTVTHGYELAVANTLRILRKEHQDEHALIYSHK